MPVRLGGALLAEFVGTFAIVFVGLLAIAFSGGGNGGLLMIALAFGLTVAVMVTATIHTSGGHFNPAVTIGLAVTGKIKPGAAVAYIFIQLVAGVVGALAAHMLVGGGETGATVVFNGVNKFGHTIPVGTGEAVITAPVALLAEVIATFFLVFVIWGSVADPRARNTGGFAIGIAVVIDILCTGPISGASMNPARSFGPALAASLLGKTPNWQQHWVYWVGPIFGGLLAAILYHVVLWPRDSRRGLDPDAVDVPVTQRP